MRLKKKKTMLLLPALFIIIVIYCCFDRAVFNALLPIAETKAQSEATKLIESSTLSAMPKDAKYALFSEESNGISSVTANTQAIQSLRTAVTDSILESTDKIFITVTVPLGSVIGGGIFTGRGLPLKVHIASAGGLRVDTESEFSSAGLNQTCHRIYVKASLDITLLYHGMTSTVTVSSKMLVSEKIIVGKVPDAYFRAYS